MKLQYIEYCFADRLFYDESSKWASEQQNYRQATTPPPEGWITNRKGPWFNYACISVRIPAQGWKIHVSARLETAQQVLDIVSEYCLKNKINFKFLIGEAAFIGRNLKYADRGAAGSSSPSTPPPMSSCGRSSTISTLPCTDWAAPTSCPTCGGRTAPCTSATAASSSG